MTYRGGDDVVGNLEIFLGDPAIRWISISSGDFDMFHVCLPELMHCYYIQILHNCDKVAPIKVLWKRSFQVILPKLLFVVSLFCINLWGLIGRPCDGDCNSQCMQVPTLFLLWSVSPLALELSTAAADVCSNLFWQVSVCRFWTCCPLEILSVCTAAAIWTWETVWAHSG